MIDKHDVRPRPGRLGLVLATVSAVLTVGSAQALADECTIHYPFGTGRLPVSDRAAGVYGADFRLLYGDWEWSTLGLDVSVAKAERYVADVAGLVLNCVGDLRYGRLDFSRHRVIDGHTQVPRNETDTEYFDRAFDDLVALRSELAVIETNYDSLLHTHAPLVQQAGSVQSLKTTVNATVLHTLGLAANRTTGIGWVIVHMQGLETALERFQSAHELTRELITVYLSEFPELRDLVIDDLISNTEGVLDQYGQFFSEQKRADLAVLLAQADQERQDEDLPAVIAELNEIASELQSELNNVWDANSSLRAIASKLKFVFGSCDTSGASHPLVSAQYFGDLAVAARIVQEGDDAPYCNR